MYQYKFELLLYNSHYIIIHNYNTNRPLNVNYISLPFSSYFVFQLLFIQMIFTIVLFFSQLDHILCNSYQSCSIISCMGVCLCLCAAVMLLFFEFMIQGSMRKKKNAVQSSFVMFWGMQDFRYVTRKLSQISKEKHLLEKESIL